MLHRAAHTHVQRLDTPAIGTTPRCRSTRRESELLYGAEPTRVELTHMDSCRNLKMLYRPHRIH